LNVCIHDTTGCQTGLTTGLTTGCIVYTNIYPVAVWQLVWQQVVSCKRGFTCIHTDTYTCILPLLLLHCNSKNTHLTFFITTWAVVAWLLPHAVNCGRFCFWCRQSVVFLCVWNISGKPLKGFVPNSQERCVWSLARTSLKVKVKVKVSRNKKRHFSAPSAACMQFMLIKHLQSLVDACSELQKVLFFGAVSLWFFVCAWNTSRTAEPICAKFAQKTCLVLHLDRRVWRSEVKGQDHQEQKTAFFGPVGSLHAVCLVKIFSL